MSKRLDYEKASRRPERPEPKGTVVAWWLTVAKSASRCHECGERICAQNRFAFRSIDRVCVCLVCVDRLGLVVEESRRLKMSDPSPDLQARRAEVKRNKPKKNRRAAKGMTVRFVCPVCGGAHARKDHA